MPTHKKTVGRVRWGVPGVAAMRLMRHDNSDWLLRCTPVATASRLAFGSVDTVVGC